MEYPRHFADAVVSTWGKKGEDWLHKLPDLVHYCSQKWHLSNPTVSKNLSYNFVVFAEADQDKVLVSNNLNVVLTQK